MANSLSKECAFFFVKTQLSGNITIKMNNFTHEVTLSIRKVQYTYTYYYYQLIGECPGNKVNLGVKSNQNTRYLVGSFFNYVDQMRQVDAAGNVNDIQIFYHNSKEISQPMSTVEGRWSIMGKIWSTQLQSGHFRLTSYINGQCSLQIVDIH